MGNNLVEELKESVEEGTAASSDLLVAEEMVVVEVVAVVEDRQVDKLCNPQHIFGGKMWGNKELCGNK